MNLLDRLIAKAKRISPDSHVCIINNEDGLWIFDGQGFSSLEEAQEHVEALMLEDDEDSVIIINDLGIFHKDALKELAVPDDWLERIKKEYMERRRQEQEKERQDRPLEKDRRLI